MALKGLVTTREIWVPTGRGWIVLGLSGLAVGLALIFNTYPFLSVHAPVGGDVLVVESWLSEKDLKAAVRIFQAGSYRQIATVGPSLDPDSFLKWRYPHLETRADVIATQLSEKGVERALIAAVVRAEVKKDRTYASAVALRRWLEKSAPSVTSLDLLSVGPHARRSWLLYELGLGRRYRVGIIAQRPRSYDPDRWWTSSAGVRVVIGESLAYLYAKFLFFP